ncbi:9026_t:CDS:2 [Ambispora gerdemannii]|uniref:9026_t:CDS:1 n=1 Tax=Ambispora gerdemannii TaxID=144530 RepID=A0A9N8W9T1_9GLOM|nr:9026_t:CDS:2 [Ambispora gerdemannii]
MKPALMMNGGGGRTVEATDYFNLRARNGEFAYYSVQMYLGGGLGGDLSRKETWDNLYIVGLFTKMKHNIGLSAAATTTIQNNNSSFTQNFPNNPQTPNPMISNSNNGDLLDSPILSPVIDPSLRDNDSSLLSRSYTPERNQASKSSALIHSEQFNYQNSRYLPPSSQHYHHQQHQAHYLQPPQTPISTDTPPLLSRSNIPSPLSLHAEKRSIPFNNQRHNPNLHLQHQPLTPTYDDGDRICNADPTSTTGTITSTTSTLINNPLFDATARSIVNELGGGVVDEDGESPTRMSVNSLLCN